jgi:hypothetical protein
LWRTAAQTPNGTPKQIATAKAANESSIVAGRNCFKSCRTGRRVVKDSPRSPFSTFVRYVKNCSGSDLSSPQRLMKAARIVGSLVACSDRTMAKGSAGTLWATRKAVRMTPNSAMSASANRRPT